VLIEGDNLTEDQLAEIASDFEGAEQIGAVRPSGLTDDGQYGKLTVSLAEHPYSSEAIEFLGDFRTDNSTYQLSDGGEVDVSFAGTTAELVDEQQINQKDIIKIVSLETLLILVFLVVLTRSVKMSLYMMAT